MSKHEQIDVEALLRRMAGSGSLKGTHPDEEDLWRFASSDISSLERKAMTSHIHSCGLCLQELGWIRMCLAAELEGSESDSHDFSKLVADGLPFLPNDSNDVGASSNYQRKSPTFVLGILAAAAIVIIAVVGFFPASKTLNVQINSISQAHRGTDHPENSYAEISFSVNLDFTGDWNVFVLFAAKSPDGIRVYSVFPTDEEGWPLNPLSSKSGPITLPPQDGPIRSYTFNTIGAGVLFWGIRSLKDAFSTLEWQVLRQRVADALDGNEFSTGNYGVIESLLEAELEEVGWEEISP